MDGAIGIFMICPFVRFLYAVKSNPIRSAKNLSSVPNSISVVNSGFKSLFPMMFETSKALTPPIGNKIFPNPNATFPGAKVENNE